MVAERLHFGIHVPIKPLYSACTLKLQWQTHIQLVHYSQAGVYTI